MMDDVLVVGAGPAGATAAMVLARAGARVRIIDRATFPRHKLCGDTLNPGALSMLDAATRAQVEARGLATTGMTVTGPGGARVAAAYPGGLHGVAVARRDLDGLLLEAAVAAGARFEPGVRARGPIVEGTDAPSLEHCGADLHGPRHRCGADLYGPRASTDLHGCGADLYGPRVTGIRLDRHDLRARVVIDAGGRHARLAFALGLSRFAAAPKRWAFGAYFEGVTDLTDRGEMHIRPDGYIGIAPLPGGLANVCVVSDIFRLKAEATDTFRLKAEATGPWAHATPVASGFSRKISDAIAADPELRERFHDARQVSATAALGPMAIESRAAGCPGLLLAGDAAGFIDPMTGDGLRFALRGGELAAEAALRELASGAPGCASLARARAVEFTGKWRLNRTLRALVGSPRSVRVAAAAATLWGAPVRTLVALAGDVPLALRKCPAR